VYLASSRDLNTGRYSHDGIAFHFSENVASKAMAACHEEIFDRLVYCSLEELIERSEEHTSELQSRFDLVCRLLLEKKNKINKMNSQPTLIRQLTVSFYQLLYHLSVLSMLDPHNFSNDLPFYIHTIINRALRRVQCA